MIILKKRVYFKLTISINCVTDFILHEFQGNSIWEEWFNCFENNPHFLSEVSENGRVHSIESDILGRCSFERFDVFGPEMISFDLEIEGDNPFKGQIDFLFQNIGDSETIINCIVFGEINFELFNSSNKSVLLIEQNIRKVLKKIKYRQELHFSL